MAREREGESVAKLFELFATFVQINFMTAG